MTLKAEMLSETRPESGDKGCREEDSCGPAHTFQAVWEFQAIHDTSLGIYRAALYAQFQPLCQLLQVPRPECRLPCPFLAYMHVSASSGNAHEK